MKGEITIERAGTDEASFLEVFDLLLAQHKEIGLCPLDEDKAIAGCFAGLSAGMTFLARRDGKPVGTLALVSQEYWYGRHAKLEDAWFFVLPRHRRGQAGKLLMKAARAEGERLGLPVFINVVNPYRRRKRTPGALMGELVGYLPVGYTLTLQK